MLDYVHVLLVASENFFRLNLLFILFSVTASQLETVNAACSVLLKYILSVLQSVCIDANPINNPIDKYLNAIQILCVGTGLLSTSEVSVLTNTMKGENLPQHNTPQPGLYPKNTGNICR